MNLNICFVCGQFGHAMGICPTVHGRKDYSFSRSSASLQKQPTPWTQPLPKLPMKFLHPILQINRLKQEIKNSELKVLPKSSATAATVLRELREKDRINLFSQGGPKADQGNQDRQDFQNRFKEMFSDDVPQLAQPSTTEKFVIPSPRKKKNLDKKRVSAAAAAAVRQPRQSEDCLPNQDEELVEPQGFNNEERQASGVRASPSKTKASWDAPGMIPRANSSQLVSDEKHKSALLKQQRESTSKVVRPRIELQKFSQIVVKEQPGHARVSRTQQVSQMSQAFADLLTGTPKRKRKERVRKPMKQVAGQTTLCFRQLNVPQTQFAQASSYLRLSFKPQKSLYQRQRLAPALEQNMSQVSFGSYLSKKAAINLPALEPVFGTVPIVEKFMEHDDTFMLEQPQDSRVVSPILHQGDSEDMVDKDDHVNLLLADVDEMSDTEEVLDLDEASQQCFFRPPDKVPEKRSSVKKVAKQEPCSLEYLLGKSEQKSAEAHLENSSIIRKARASTMSKKTETNSQKKTNDKPRKQSIKIISKGRPSKKTYRSKH